MTNTVAIKSIIRLVMLTDVFQSSQVDLLAKSEIFDDVAVVCDAAGVTLLGGEF